MVGRWSKNRNAKCSKKYSNPYANTNSNSNLQKQYDLQLNRTETRKLSVAPEVPEKVEKIQAREVVSAEGSTNSIGGYASSEDEFYDGIPRFKSSLSQRSRSRRAKVSYTFLAIIHFFIKMIKARGKLSYCLLPIQIETSSFEVVASFWFRIDLI